MNNTKRKIERFLRLKYVLINTDAIFLTSLKFATLKARHRI